MNKLFCIVLSMFLIVIQSNISYGLPMLDYDTRSALLQEAYDSYIYTYVLSYCRARKNGYKPTPAAEYAYEKAAKVFVDLTEDFFSASLRSQVLEDLRVSQYVAKNIREYCPEYPF